VGNGRYFILNVPIGEQAFSAGRHSDSELTVNVAEGSRSFICCAMEQDFFSPRPVLSLLSVRSFVAVHRNLRYVDRDDRRSLTLDEPLAPSISLPGDI
jgi:hypothetical protein